MDAQQPADLRAVQTRFTNYYFARKRAHDEHGLLLSEANSRLGQMVWLLDRVRRLEDLYSKQRARRSASRRKTATIDQLWLMTEAFYYFAFRFRQVLRSAGFKNFDPVGVREVRNFLIEHPQKKAGIVLQTLQFGDKNGPVLKPFGGSEESVRDPGLYVNAREFQEKLERALTRAEAG